MDSADEAYAIGLLNTWYVRNVERFRRCGAASSFKMNEGGSASVWLQTANHLVDIGAWNYASCLNITYMELESERYDCLHEGSCDSEDDFRQ